MQTCFSKKPLAHWPITLLPFIAKLLKRAYVVAISSSSLSGLLHQPSQACILPVAPDQLMVRLPVTATL